MKNIVKDLFAVAALVAALVAFAPAVADETFIHRMDLVGPLDTREAGPRIDVYGHYKLKPGPISDAELERKARDAAEILRRSAGPQTRIGLDRFRQVWYLTKNKFTPAELAQLLVDAGDRVLLVDHTGGVFHLESAVAEGGCGDFTVTKGRDSWTLTAPGCAIVMAVYSAGRQT